jgi:hypothetical protein
MPPHHAAAWDICTMSVHVFDMPHVLLQSRTTGIVRMQETH